jgi:transcriptional regulator with XRE-family HTH domain
MKTDQEPKTPPMRRVNREYKPMETCLGCDRPDTFGVAMRPTRPIIDGEEFVFESEKYHCTACGAEWMSPTQADAIVIKGVSLFQKKYGMLNGAEVKARREKLGWTQEDLVKASEVSIATIKRLESGVHILTKPNNDALEKALETAQQRRNLASALATSWKQMEAMWTATADWSIESDLQAAESTADVSESMALAADSNELALAA